MASKQKSRKAISASVSAKYAAKQAELRTILKSNDTLEEAGRADATNPQELKQDSHSNRCAVSVTLRAASSASAHVARAWARGQIRLTKSSWYADCDNGAPGGAFFIPSTSLEGPLTRRDVSWSSSRSAASPSRPRGSPQAPSTASRAAEASIVDSTRRLGGSNVLRLTWIKIDSIKLYRLGPRGLPDCGDELRYPSPRRLRGSAHFFVTL